MGCFSFMCKECGEAILSNSFRGEKVNLYLLEGGVVLEKMNGEYDSYGRVFDKNGESIKWSAPWSAVCDLMFSDDVSNGIAAVHKRCITRDIPNTRSEDDPDQGWGSSSELLANCSKDLELN